MGLGCAQYLARVVQEGGGMSCEVLARSPGGVPLLLAPAGRVRRATPGGKLFPASKRRSEIMAVPAGYLVRTVPGN